MYHINELTNPNKWDDPEWMQIHRDLEGYATDKHCFSETKEFAYRKGWEWTQAIYGLHNLGAIKKEAKGLGVGAGREPLLFYLADRIEMVVGTDLYGNEAWSSVHGKEADKRLVEDASEFCPRAYDKTRLTIKTMDGTDLKFADDSFDFVWSLSSIEHFGGHDRARKAVQEMARVTSKGGIISVATEFIITPGIIDHPEFFSRQKFDYYIVKASPDLELVEEIDYRLPPLEYLIDPIMVHLAHDVHRRRHHIILNDGTYQWTSIIVFFRKK